MRIVRRTGDWRKVLTQARKHSTMEKLQRLTGSPENRRKKGQEKLP